jgi:hypothetical protein
MLAPACGRRASIGKSREYRKRARAAQVLVEKR